MKMSNTAIASFIDQRYLPLEQKYKIVIAVSVLLLTVVLFYFLLFQSNSEQIATLSAQQATLETKLKEIRTILQNRPKLQHDLDETKAVFEEASKLLPKEKEIPKLLSDISSVGRTAGLDFLSFKPQTDVPKDFYSEIPIEIDLIGPYHNVGFFFDQVSRLDRIVSVLNVKMGTPKKEGNEMLLNSSCRLITYRFTNIELPKNNSTNTKK
ncbi:MAG: type 4a pilus biogenesis protein PilO [Desulfocapsaceae bacterium]|nr:type 4a pilus biogenesis protein PilO [Desulfocapsaceae bacterium]